MAKKILAIDSSYLMYKSHYAFNKNHLSVFIGDQELITSSIYGFLRELINLKLEHDYKYFVTCWDTPPYTKKNMFSDYKEGRKSTVNINDQREILKQILISLKIKCCYENGYEGEEVVRYFIDKYKNDEVDVYTADEDCYALISGNNNIVNTSKNELTIFDEESLNDKYGVTSKQFVAFKAITGCGSDHIKGVNGIGPKGATKLASKYNNIQGVIKNSNNINDKKMKTKIGNSMKDGSLRKSIYLTKIRKPDKVLNFKDNGAGYIDILEVLEFNSFLTGKNKMALKVIKKDQEKFEKERRRM